MFMVNSYDLIIQFPRRSFRKGGRCSLFMGFGIKTLSFTFDQWGYQAGNS